MTTGLYDLHTHSQHSDGTNTVHEIAKLVSEAQLAGFALTDHDTMSGWDEARQAATQYGIDYIPGVELTTKLGRHSVHLLGYGFDAEDAALNAKLEEIRTSRSTRAQRIVARLAADFPISWESVVASSSESIGRPHIADELVRLGIVPDRSAAFADLLSHNSKYYVPNLTFNTVEAVEMVTAAGGATVLAHPAAIRNQVTVGEAEIAQLVAAGLRGIELRHPENNPDVLAPLQALAAQFDLLVTGSSDFHGAGKPNRIGDETTDAATVKLLREWMRFPR